MVSKKAFAFYLRKRDINARLLLPNPHERLIIPRVKVKFWIGSPLQIELKKKSKKVSRYFVPLNLSKILHRV